MITSSKARLLNSAGTALPEESFISIWGSLDSREKLELLNRKLSKLPPAVQPLVLAGKDSSLKAALVSRDDISSESVEFLLSGRLTVAYAKALLQNNKSALKAAEILAIQFNTKGIPKSLVAPVFWFLSDKFDSFHASPEYVSLLEASWTEIFCSFLGSRSNSLSLDNSRATPAFSELCVKLAKSNPDVFKKGFLKTVGDPSELLGLPEGYRMLVSHVTVPLVYSVVSSNSVFSDEEILMLQKYVDLFPVKTQTRYEESFVSKQGRYSYQNSFVVEGTRFYVSQNRYGYRSSNTMDSYRNFRGFVERSVDAHLSLGVDFSNPLTWMVFQVLYLGAFVRKENISILKKLYVKASAGTVSLVSNPWKYLMDDTDVVSVHFKLQYEQALRMQRVNAFQASSLEYHVFDFVALRNMLSDTPVFNGFWLDALLSKDERSSENTWPMPGVLRFASVAEADKMLRLTISTVVSTIKAALDESNATSKRTAMSSSAYWSNGQVVEHTTRFMLLVATFASLASP